MIENLPAYISIIFVLTTFSTVGFFLYAIRQKVSQSPAPKILLFLIPLWILFQAVLALPGFYSQTDTFPPRIFAFAVLPSLLLIILLFVLARKNFVEKISLKTLILLSVVRIPVEIVLF